MNRIKLFFKWLFLSKKDKNMMRAEKMVSKTYEAWKREGINNRWDSRLLEERYGRLIGELRSYKFNEGQSKYADNSKPKKNKPKPKQVNKITNGKPKYLAPKDRKKRNVTKKKNDKDNNS